MMPDALAFCTQCKANNFVTTWLLVFPFRLRCRSCGGSFTPTYLMKFKEKETEDVC